LFYVNLLLEPGARFPLPADQEERAAYVVEGNIAADGETHGPGNLIVFGGGDAVIAAEGPAHVMLLGGAALGQRHIWWNFVSSRLDRIEQAKADWKAGRMTLPPDDNKEFVPAPEDPIGVRHPA
jgi:redox-sensitive bicupin YhaK (pirin superfamily)